MEERRRRLERVLSDPWESGGRETWDSVVVRGIAGDGVSVDKDWYADDLEGMDSEVILVLTSDLAFWSDNGISFLSSCFSVFRW